MSNPHAPNDPTPTPTDEMVHDAIEQWARQHLDLAVLDLLDGGVSVFPDELVAEFTEWTKDRREGFKEAEAEDWWRDRLDSVSPEDQARMPVRLTGYMTVIHTVYEIVGGPDPFERSAGERRRALYELGHWLVRMRRPGEGVLVDTVERLGPDALAAWLEQWEVERRDAIYREGVRLMRFVEAAQARLGGE